MSTQSLRRGVCLSVPRHLTRRHKAYSPAARGIRPDIRKPGRNQERTRNPKPLPLHVRLEESNEPMVWRSDPQVLQHERSETHAGTATTEVRTPLQTTPLLQHPTETPRPRARSTRLTVLVRR